MVNNLGNIKHIVLNCVEILKIVLRYKKSYLFILILLSIILSFIPYVSLFVSQFLLNKLQMGGEHIEEIIYVIILYAFIKIISLSVSIINNYITTRYKDYLYCELNIFFHKKCTELTYSDFEDDIVYDLLQRAEQEIGIRPTSLIFDILGLFSGILSFIVSIVILSSWHSWIIIGFILLPVFSYKHFVSINKKEYMMQYERTEVERKSWYYNHLLIKDYFVKEVKLLDISDYLLNKHNIIQKRLFEENTLMNKKRTIFNWFYQASNTIFTMIVIVVSMMEAFLGKILLGNLMTYINTTSKVETSITNVSNYCFNIYTDGLYCEHILNFLKIVKSRDKEDVKKMKIEKIDSIEFKNVSYKYRRSKYYALKNINFKLLPNTITAIVGENGSGKTTLIKILTGLYDDYEGEVLVNGINLNNVDKKSYRQCISAVFQDFNNYEFTVNENISISNINDKVDVNKIQQVAKLSGASNIIEKLPLKYDQQLGNWFDNGVQLSGGEWQKIAIARCLYRNANIYILDEPTSSLDPSSEFLFFKNFLKIIDTKIGVFVTHRFTNVEIADEIIVMKNGQVIECGNHKMLMNNNNEYSRLYNLQLGVLKMRKDD